MWSVEEQAQFYTEIDSSELPPSRPGFAGIPALLEKHKEQVESFEVWAKCGAWNSFHHNHYDWWAFPIDAPSSWHDKWELTLRDVVRLLANREFVLELRRGVELLMLAWGWDTNAAQLVTDPDTAHGQKWSHWAVRLYKAGRCMHLFQQYDYSSSLIAYSRWLLMKFGESSSFDEMWSKWAEGEARDRAYLTTLRRLSRVSHCPPSPPPCASSVKRSQADSRADSPSPQPRQPPVAFSRLTSFPPATDATAMPSPPPMDLDRECKHTGPSATEDPPHASHTTESSDDPFAFPAARVSESSQPVAAAGSMASPAESNSLHSRADDPMMLSSRNSKSVGPMRRQRKKPTFPLTLGSGIYRRIEDFFGTR